MGILLSLIAQLDPWWVVALAVLLVIFSFTVFESEYLLSASGGLIFWAAFLALPTGPIFKLIALPPCLFGAYFAQVKLIKKVSLKEIPMEQDARSKIGRKGSLKVIELDTSGESFYYQYKNQISEETITQKARPTLRYRVVLETGESLDANPVYEGPMAGDSVVTIAIENGTAIVDKVG